MRTGLESNLILDHVIDSEIEGVEGVRPLPVSLEHALSFLVKDVMVQSWFDPILLSTFLGIRASEAHELIDLSPEERCTRYVNVY